MFVIIDCILCIDPLYLEISLRAKYVMGALILMYLFLQLSSICCKKFYYMFYYLKIK